jgi:Cu(I)/Ag(I) efflux system membrane protein CusA/SilA
VGSVWALHLLGYALSPAVWVGMLSLVGLATQTGIVMVVYIDVAFFGRLRRGLILTPEDILIAHAEGTIARVRPKVMTLAAMGAGLCPLLWAEGPGAEIVRRVAAPMLGGLVTSAFLTLELVPVLYTMWRTRQLARARREGRPLGEIVGPPPRWSGV